MKKGFTLIEIVIVVAILTILTAIIVNSFSLFNKKVTLSRDAEKIVSMLYQARTNTIASKNDVQYGVHFEVDRAIIFSGASYSSGATDNDIFFLKTFESLSNISLAGTSDDVIFDRITGATSNFGSITISTTGAGATSRVIFVSANGLVNLQ